MHPVCHRADSAVEGGVATAASASTASSSSVTSSGSALPGLTFQSESYREGLTAWPSRGRHVLAQYHPPGTIRHLTGDDDGAILVYQAYSRAIGEYVLEHQSFDGCPGFKLTRMSWLKTNFLWMMYRCGWASKSSQDMVLGVWIRTSFFERLLLKCAATQGKGTKAKEILAKQKDFQQKLKKSKCKAGNDDSSDESTSDHGNGGGDERNMVCRFQWDPDHAPNGDAVPYRKAVQIGMRGQLFHEYAARRKEQLPVASASSAARASASAGNAAPDVPIGAILSIVDVTPLVLEQRAQLEAMKRADKTQPYTLLVAKERIYTHLPAAIAKHIGLDAPEQSATLASPLAHAPAASAS